MKNYKLKWLHHKFNHSERVIITAVAAVNARDAAPSMIVKLMSGDYPYAMGLTVAPTAELYQTLKPVWKVKGIPMLRVIAPFKEVKPRDTVHKASILPSSFTAYSQTGIKSHGLVQMLALFGTVTAV